MTVRHVLLVCPNWQDIRQDIGLLQRDIRWALTTREGASKVIRFVLQTGLLEQFKLHACKSQEIRAVPVRGEEEIEGVRREEGEEEEEEGEGGEGGEEGEEEE